MSSTDSAQTWLRDRRAKAAQRRIVAFANRFQDRTSHLYLVYHAALPLVLTPDLLYLIWANFQRDIHGEMLHIPWIAVADLLLSELCQEVGRELYEMDTVIRSTLLQQMQQDERFGLKRLHEVAHFLMEYIGRQKQSLDPYLEDMHKAQRWAALAYTNPNSLAHEIAIAFHENATDRAALARLTSLTESLAVPLAEHKPLLVFAEGMSYLTRGDIHLATAKFTQLSSGGQSVEIVGVLLQVPRSVLSGYDDATLVTQKPTTGFKVPRSESFVQTWRLRNTGTTTWGEGYTLAEEGAETAPRISLPLTQPGQIVEVAVKITADFIEPAPIIEQQRSKILPEAESSVTVEPSQSLVWHLQNSRGEIFGPELSVTFTVVPPLYILIAQHFNLHQLAELCNVIGADIENFVEDDLLGKTQQLQDFARRHHQTQELLVTVMRLRPYLDLAPYREAPLPIPGTPLYQIIAQYFDFLELWDLSFRLDIDFENLAGTIHREKAQALVERMQRFGQLPELLDEVHSQRPFLDLTPYTQAASQPPSNFSTLQELITYCFDADELAMLYFNLGLDIATQLGSTNREKVVHLVDIIEKQDRLGELLGEITRVRPHLDLRLFGDVQYVPRNRFLYLLLDDCFNLDELAILCFDLGYDINDLPGKIKSRKAMELQKLAANQGRIPELIQIISDKWPDLDLKPYGFSLPQGRWKQRTLKLYELIADSLSFEQVKILCSVLNCDTDALPGSGKTRIAMELQKFVQQQGRMTEFLQEINRLAPSLDLGPYLSPLMPTMTWTIIYVNFDIRIGSKTADGRYPLSAESLAGETKPVLQTLSNNDTEFQDLVAFLRDLIAREEDVEQLGTLLKNFLFPQEVLNLFGQSLIRAKNEGKTGLRVRLKMEADSTELHHIPWEYCMGDRSFLALNKATPVVRYIPVDKAIETVASPNPIRILVVMASPSDQDALDMAAEEKQIRDALSKLEQQGRIQIKVIPHTTRRELRVNLYEFDPHILHFVGHGTVKSNGEGALALEGPDGKTQLVDSNDMMLLLQGSSIKLVVLNACKTAAQGEGKAFMGVAPKLVWAGVPAVIAMQFSIPDTTAVAFMRDFYDGLAKSKPLDTAVTEARMGVYFDYDDKYFWAIPVLFMRSPDGVIWQ